VNESGFDALTGMLIFVEDMNRSCEILGDPRGTAEEHSAAARSVVKALCRGLSSFERISLAGFLEPSNLPPEASVVDADRKWLRRLSFSLHDALDELGVKDLFWPPRTEKGEQPSIVRDLDRLYDDLVFQFPYRKPVTAEDLLETVVIVKEKACSIEGDWPNRGGATTKVLMASNNAPKFARLYNAMTVMGLLIAIMQVPGTVNHLSGDIDEFDSRVARLVDSTAAYSYSELNSVNHKLNRIFLPRHVLRM
jgi:hypothetical protein